LTEVIFRRNNSKWYYIWPRRCSKLSRFLFW